MDRPGRPSLYKPNSPSRPSSFACGRHQPDLADTFEVGHSTIDNWLQKHPEFAHR